MARRISSAMLMVLMTVLAANMLLFSFGSSSVFAAEPQTRGNPFDPDAGVVGVGETTGTTDCIPQTSTASSTKGGVYFKFKVPTTISDIEAAGNPAQSVNIHTAFYGDDGGYREVGLYYGNWDSAPGIGYDPDVFQFAWGIGDASGGELKGVIPLSVVEGHTVELWFVYFESTGKWNVLYDDLNDGTGIQSIAVETSTVKVKSDYWVFIENSGLTPNSNAQTLGLVEVLSVQKATRISGDGVSLSNWADGYVITDCAVANDDYGVTDTGTSKFKFGWGGAEETNGHQLW